MVWGQGMQNTFPGKNIIMLLTEKDILIPLAKDHKNLLDHITGIICGELKGNMGALGGDVRTCGTT